MQCHMIFDIKMEDLRRKSWLVAGGHMTDAPATTTFAALTLAGLNDLQVKVSDIENAYITARALRKSGPFSAPNLDQMLGKALSLCAHSMV